MSLTFNFTTKSIHNGYLLTINIYGGHDKATNLTWPSVNLPETFYATREEVAAVCQNVIEWSLLLKPKASVTKKETDKKLPKPKE